MAVPQTPARAGLARSNAVRAGYPILAGERLPLYALSNIARSNAFRAGHHRASVFIAIDGIHYGTGRTDPATRVLIESLTVTEVIDETPNRATFTTMGFAPTVGQSVVITLGSTNNSARSFAGQILAIDQSYAADNPVHAQYRVDCIDPQWGMDKRLVTGRYTGSATTIAQALVATYAPGYAPTFIAPGLEAIDEITFTEETLSDALTRLAKRIGGYWYADYLKAVHLWTGAEDLAFAGLTNPVILNRVHASLRELASTRDLSQVVTRVRSEGGGANALAPIAPGETLLPVETAAWYNPAGGQVRSGPQHVRYTGVLAGGRGTLVGPGARPVVAPTLDLVSGAGIDAGTHEYAVSFVTAAGESLAGPVATIATGPVTPPAAPTAGPPTAGTGPNPGTHLYAVTFVNNTGETTPSATLTAATGLTPAPEGALTPGAPINGPGPDPGLHDYAVTFVTAVGETAPGPLSQTVVTTAPMDPPPAPTATAIVGTELGPGPYRYKTTFVTAEGETTASVASNAVTFPTVAVPINSGIPQATTGGSLPPASYLYVLTYLVGTGETTIGTTSGAVNVGQGEHPGTNAVQLTALPTSPDPRVTARRIYRASSATGGVYRLLTTIANNTATSYLDTAAATGAEIPPSTNTSARGRMQVASLATGPAGTTARRIYRTESGGATYYRLATLSDNVTTSYTDATTTVSTANPEPGANTTGQLTVPLTAIPKGASEVTGRKIYRRSAGLGPKLVGTLANNTATTFQDTIPNSGLGAVPPAVSTAYVQRIPLTIATGPSTVTARKIYRSTAGGATLLLAATIADNVTTSWVDTVVDSALGAAAPAVNTASASRVNLSAIPVGAATVTARKLYRSAANQVALKLLTTLADNVTTTYADTAADAALGAAAPVTDTSGLTQPQGVVTPGATTLIVAGTGWASAAGGWAIIGNGAQVIRYTGLTSNTLTGIPASGDGSITASISYNSTITAAPLLTGIPALGTGAIRYAIRPGDPVNLVVVVDDLGAQAALAALIGGDGIQETPLSDNRISEAEARARGEALLTLRGAVEVAIRYRVRDLNTHAGRTVTVNLGPPTDLYGTFTIQQVTMTPTTTAATIMPTYQVEASTTRLSFENLIALARKAKG